MSISGFVKKVKNKKKAGKSQGKMTPVDRLRDAGARIHNAKCMVQ